MLHFTNTMSSLQISVSLQITKDTIQIESKTIKVSKELTKIVGTKKKIFFFIEVHTSDQKL